ncbi:YuiB family protein [Radiobacillus kanasensis]|uniref:YuiB family protein n=1 Tax=Radiobacillus kanasensis TaxID=2844358 RepID=UPI001E338E67|nr:YuiB family protein [Radiobacillus kanasensis]UFT98213.1 YuiB family protein [Radiobacillus kanasensis]
MIQFIVSILLFFVLFFGIGFILNMLLRSTWVMSFVYPIVVCFIVDDFPFSTYFLDTGKAFSTLWHRITILTPVDITILSAGFVGTIVAGFVIRWLRKQGYQMF